MIKRGFSNEQVNKLRMSKEASQAGSACLAVKATYSGPRKSGHHLLANNGIFLAKTQHFYLSSKMVKDW